MQPFELLSTEEQRAYRHAQSQQLAQLAGACVYGAAETPPVESVQDSRFDDVYGQLGEQLYNEFITGDVTATAEFATEHVLHGFYIATALIKHVAEAYERFAETTDRTPHIDELTAVLAASRDSLLTLFAMTSWKINRTYETWFILFENSPEPFVVQEEDERLIVVPSPRLMRYAREDALDVTLDEPENALRHRRCPAIGIMLNGVWDKAVLTAAEDPKLFAATLGLVGAEEFS